MNNINIEAGVMLYVSSEANCMIMYGLEKW